MAPLRGQNLITYLIWLTLALAMLLALATGRWMVGFVSAATLILSLVPPLAASRLEIHLPRGFVAVATIFIFATLFLGEVLDFYERIWWWDLALHGLSAIGFGMIGFLFVFILFEGDRYAAPAWALGLIAFCVAVTVGVTWEVFEYSMDRLFGLDMQKSGLDDTMSDLIVDLVGALIGGAAGFVYAKGRAIGGPGVLIEEFVRLNRRLFRRFRDR